MKGESNIDALFLTFLLFSWLATSTGLKAEDNNFEYGVAASVIEDNNIFRTQNKTRDSITSIAPFFRYSPVNGRKKLIAEYQGNYARFANHDALNYLEHDVLIGTTFGLGEKLSSDLRATYQNQIEQPGTNNAITTELNEFSQRTAKQIVAKLLYGTKQSTGQFVVGYRNDRFNYLNNEQSFRNYQKETLVGLFYYRVAPSSRVFIEVKAADIAYENTQNYDLSSQQTFYLTGAEWALSAATSGTVKLGYLNVDYKSEDYSSLSGLSYFLDLDWRPTTYTTINLSADKQAKESAEQSIGGFISSEFEFSIDHEFTPNTLLAIGYKYEKNDYSNSQSREDKLQEVGLQLSHQSKSWLQIVTGISNYKRKSNLDSYTFDATVIEIGVVLSFE